MPGTILGLKERVGGAGEGGPWEVPGASLTFPTMAAPSAHFHIVSQFWDIAQGCPLEGAGLLISNPKAMYA